MEENEKYLEAKEMLSQIKEKYQMEELTATFLSSKSEEEKSGHFWINVFLISLSITFVLFIGKNRTEWV